MADQGGRTALSGIRSPQDFVGGLVLVAIAAAGLWLARDLSAMRGFNFGSGTVPRIFAGLLGALGVMVTITGITGRGPSLERFPLRGPLLILGAAVFFGLFIRPLGLAITGVITVFAASFAVNDSRLQEAAIFAVVMTAFCAFLFPYALSQPIPLWPTWRF
jgi:hypothetical protein